MNSRKPSNFSGVFPDRIGRLNSIIFLFGQFVGTIVHSEPVLEHPIGSKWSEDRPRFEFWNEL
ncbi:hypothetical protein A0128_01610 [Leptospira tipperaryensis]|uniref:Uncharacterized protein n=1 Tax=Leptospira tipperaryensis TaxID=2564040 RepID=A0A1D7USQ8_9LEPT|nr:hypothetical protein A0128_01610 [Leptospira tipperaryensis]